MREKTNVSIRAFTPDDAENISALFRAVYGDRYVYPDVYLPSMIRHHNAQQHWQSSVACIDDQIVGHAMLWRHVDHPHSAELSLNVVHPAARGLGLATTLGRHLCDQARRQGLRMLTIKQVSSHTQSQRLAHTLGFHTTGLLLDYVASPFNNVWRESIVLGCLPLQPYPIPSLSWPQTCPNWLQAIEQRFGTCPSIDHASDSMPLSVTTHEQRIEITLHDLHPDRVHEATNMPKERLSYIKLRLSQRTPAAMQQLLAAGFAYAGFIPGADEMWYGLMQRGYQKNALDLHCPLAHQLYLSSLNKHHHRPLEPVYDL